MTSFNFDVQRPTPSRPGLKILLAIGLIAGIVSLSSTLASNININTGHAIEFGQGITQVTACTGTDYVIVTPTSTYINGVGSTEFSLNSFSLTHIPASCWGKSFLFQSYDLSGDLMQINATNTSASVTYQGPASSSQDGAISAATGENTAGSYGTFTLTLTTPAALAINVSRIVVQSSSVSGGIPTDGLVLFLDAANYSGSGNWIDQSPSGFDGVIHTGIDGGEITWVNQFGGAFESNGVNGFNNHIRIDMNSSLQSHPYSVIAISRYLPGGEKGRTLNADNNWLLGHWNNRADSFYDSVNWVHSGSYSEDWAVYAATGDPTSDSKLDSYYLNGVLAATSNTGYSGPQNLSAMGGGDWANETSHAQIAAIIAYDRVLTAEEVSAIYDYYKARFNLN